MSSFKDWTTKYELSDSTVEYLKDNGFDSVQSCELLSTAIIQKNFAKSLSLGQTLLLQKAVEALCKVPPSEAQKDTVRSVDTSSPSSVGKSQDTNSLSSAAAATVSTDAIDNSLRNQGLDATTLMGILGASSGNTDNLDNGKGHTFDPFSVSNGSPTKFYDIRDFVTVIPAERKEGGSIKVGDFELNLSGSKPKLDSITQMQYMEASLRILREMATKDGASLPGVLQYVGYLIKLANMGQRFQWKSVLKYDAEYRKAQAETGFPYGSDSSYMMQLFLRDRLPQEHYSATKPSPNSGAQHPQMRYDPGTGKPICGQYNSSKGCQLQRCKFAHVCRACFKSHSFINHNEHAASNETKN